MGINLSCSEVLIADITGKKIKAVISKPSFTPDKEIDGNHILEKVKQKYLALNSYKSKGHTEYFSVVSEQETKAQTDFTIEYAYPSQMKIDWKDSGKIKTFLSTDNNAFLLVDGETEKTFDDAMWGLSSVSTGGRELYRFEIANILLGKERGQGVIPSFNFLKEIKIAKEEKIDNTDCFVIQGVVKDDELVEITYWIDKESFFIRQYQRKMISRSNSDWFFNTIETYSNIE